MNDDEERESEEKDFIDHIEKLDDLEKFFTFKMPEKYNYIKDYFDKGYKSFFWEICDSGEGGNFIQTILRRNMGGQKGEDFDLINFDSIWFAHDDEEMKNGKVV
jgi:hypothetical protein